jgi:hypothetical protein
MKKTQTSSTFTWIHNKTAQVMIAVWILAMIVAYILGANGLPFNRPVLQSYSPIQQLINQNLQLFFVFILIVVSYYLTRKRALPDFNSRVPERNLAKKEMLYLILYGIVVLFIGGYFGIGMHLHGAIYGPTEDLTPAKVWTWVLYNFIFFAVIPYSIFRSRGYSNKSMGLHSLNLKNDLLLIFTILIIETAGELAFFKGIFSLTANQLLLGIPLSMIINLVGTSIPIMIFIYCILLPRYIKVSGSMVTAAILGGLTYAGVHVFEYWAVYTSLSTSILSITFIFFQFFGPGLFKSFVTLRTGNAWVHLWAYHAIAPHVTVDTPYIVNIFNIKE